MSKPFLRAAGVAVAVGVVLTWGLLGGLAWPARSYATFLLVPLPALLLLQTRFMDQLPEGAEREAVYVSSAMSVWTLAAFAMLAARFSDFDREQLWLTWPGTVTTAVTATAAVAAGIALMAGARALQVRESPLIHYLLPRNSSEKIAFAGLSVSAGIAEELVFRAFLMAALLQAGATLAATVAISVAVFALSHAYQGVGGVIRVTLLGAVLTAPVLLTGSVYPSMIAHAALDLLAGLVLGNWLVGGSEH